MNSPGQVKADLAQRVPDFTSESLRSLMKEVTVRDVSGEAQKLIEFYRYGYTRSITIHTWNHLRYAISLLDKEVTGKWTQLEWSSVQQSAALMILFPELAARQGNTTHCGAMSTLEGMASSHPELYARLVLSYVLFESSRSRKTECSDQRCSFL